MAETHSTRRRRPDQTAQPDIATDPVDTAGTTPPTKDEAPKVRIEEPVLVAPFRADGVTVQDAEGRVIAVCGGIHQLMPTRARLADIVAATLNHVPAEVMA